jgi:hypothetical protein|tara:strand:+ start:2820 stop:3530 length:711 start_codon:yes stop_codon:yes gene_type:complete
MAGARGPKIVTGGLVLAVDAGNTKSYPGSGTTWSDTSGGGHEGTLSGMGSTHFDSADGGSFEFFGGLYTNNQIDIDIGDSLVKDFTLDFWMKSAADIEGRGAIAFGDTGSGINLGFIAAYILQTNLCTFWWGTESARTSKQMTAVDLADNKWHHIVQNYDGTNAKVYVDTNLVLHDSTTFSGNLRDGISSNLRIGRWRESQTTQDMKISAVKVYNKALTASEVKENFDALRGRYGI